jgi:hypothetical protein
MIKMFTTEICKSRESEDLCILKIWQFGQYQELKILREELKRECHYILAQLRD